MLFIPVGLFSEYFNMETQVFLAVGNSFEFISLIIFSPLFSQGSSHIDVVSYRGILYFYCLFFFISFVPPSVWVMSSASSSNPLLSFPFLLSFLISKSSVMLSNYPFNTHWPTGKVDSWLNPGPGEELLSGKHAITVCSGHGDIRKGMEDEKQVRQIWRENIVKNKAKTPLHQIDECRGPALADPGCLKERRHRWPIYL